MEKNGDEEIIDKHDEEENIMDKKHHKEEVVIDENNDDDNNDDENNDENIDEKKVGKKQVDEVSENKKQIRKIYPLSKRCKYCDRAFSHISILKIHIRSHTGERPFQCSQCGKAFARNGQLKSHLKIHSGQKPYQCAQCGKGFIDNYHLIAHLRTHTGEKLYQCNECDKKFSQSGHLLSHMKTHTGEKPFKCSVCEKAFLDRGSLKKHMRIHTGEKPYECKECGKAFSENGSLSKHMKMHSGERPYQCTLCGKPFALICHLKSHMMIHSGEKPHKCNQCDKSFQQISTLKGHLRTHSGEKPYKCKHCDKAFAQNSSLKKHWKKYTEENGTLSCVPEDKTPKIVTHEEPVDRPYKCTQCPQSFTLNSRLKSHMWVHNGEKPYKCNICDMAFSKSKRLNWHLKMHASGTLTKHMLPTTVDRPHKCNQCDNAFTRNASLKRHMKVHSGEEPLTISKHNNTVSKTSSLKENVKKQIQDSDPPSPWDGSDDEFISEEIDEEEETRSLSHVTDNKIAHYKATKKMIGLPARHNTTTNRKLLEAISTVSETLSHGLEHPEIYLTMFNTSLSQLGHPLVTIPESALSVSRNLNFSKKANFQLPGPSHSTNGHLNIHNEESGPLSCVPDSKILHSAAPERYTGVPTRYNANESSNVLEATSIVSETLSRGLENPEAYVNIFNKCISQLGHRPVVIPESVIDISRNLHSQLPTLLPTSTTQQFNMISHAVMPSHHPSATQSRHGPYQPPLSNQNSSRSQPSGSSLPIQSPPIQPNSSVQNNAHSLTYHQACPNPSHPNTSYSPPIHNSNNPSVTSSIMLFASASYQPYPPHTNHPANTPPWN